jgi:predicted enzyme related to lactoylglutathione lyase
MDNTTNALNWFEIPVTDMQRAKHFYQVVFGIHMEDINMPDMGMEMAGFPMEMGSGKVSGALVKSDYHRPSKDGVVIYLNANPDMKEILERIEDEHGEVVMPKTQISPEIGYMAFFIDTEGNRIALHSQN